MKKRLAIQFYGHLRNALRIDKRSFKFYAYSEPFRYVLDFNLGSAFCIHYFLFLSYKIVRR
ncbi:hypothetical protein DMB91_07375 [Campylobacter sp. MIT 97-5078]|nr:hypothetical protein LR59_10225 [Campylobacter sp. MIT 97-5078]KGI56838.1 hypothetical protein LR59_04990 [Campylobacter sp. MIT 97-5078]TQR25615.1 hypothetical protein DMB91_07375 [Campylobacter sp. MIT 97-5078]